MKQGNVGKGINVGAEVRLRGMVKKLLKRERGGNEALWRSWSGK